MPFDTASTGEPDMPGKADTSTRNAGRPSKSTSGSLATCPVFQMGRKCVVS
jgi:hypothetical protein